MIQPGRRERAASLLARLSLIGPLGALGRRSRLTVLAYHRVLDIPDEDAFPFDPELVSASPAAFRRQMRYVRAHFDAITFAELLEGLDGAAPLPDRPLIVTFDDGFDDNCEHAFPILTELGIPATIFLATGYIGSDETFWYERLAHALLRAPEGEVEVPDGGAPLRLGDVGSRRRAHAGLIRHLAGLTDEARRRCLSLLGGRLDMSVSGADASLSRPLSWDQVRRMHEAGMEFGSHTVSHPILSRCSPTRLERELLESSRTMARQLGRAPQVIAYPFGGPREYDDRVMEAARRAGYRVGVSYVAGVNDLRRPLGFELRRIHVERITDMSTFASMLQLPRLFARP